METDSVVCVKGIWFSFVVVVEALLALFPLPLSLLLYLYQL
jgi:hypothetical protein